MNNKILASIMGSIIGDAFGVPYEFQERFDSINDIPEYMISGGVWNQVKGTWSDDSSMLLCLIESINESDSDIDIKTLNRKFLDWYKHAYMTAHDEVFDIGNTTRRVLDCIDYKGLENYQYCGEEDINSNGNGSLMRILPLAFFYKDDEYKYKKVNLISGITHNHDVSKIGCNIYIDYIHKLMKYEDKFIAYKKMINNIKDVYNGNIFLTYYERILNGEINDLNINTIKSSGYIVDTLESVFWCFLNSNSYKESIKLSIMLGGDTDTIASITGGISGYFYGFDEIPNTWLEDLANKEMIYKIIEKFISKVQN